ncbi:hypothetical protein ACIPCF_19550 (plasmid) [Paracoccus marcusii]|uniref:hypothetical protein n=1 Tax=Paracoccus marcusii TaxID=59779 RepID=UPI0038BD9E57
MTEQERLDMYVTAALTGLLANHTINNQGHEYIAVTALALAQETKRQVDLFEEFAAKSQS